MNLYGLILAGGKSSRMGFNKALLNFHGEPQVNWLNKLLQTCCDQVFISGSPENISGDFDFIEDHYESGGPLNGILSAFRLHPDISWLAVPVDMPHMGQEAISFLIENRSKTNHATCFLSEDGKIEPLPVILEPSSYSLLLSRFEQSDTSLNNFLKTGAHLLKPLDAQWLINVNTPNNLKPS